MLKFTPNKKVNEFKKVNEQKPVVIDENFCAEEELEKTAPAVDEKFEKKKL